MRPFLGYGLGLRPDHYTAVLEQHPPVDWFEVISENFLVPGGRPLHYLMRIREHYPVVLHGVSLSIGSVDPLNQDYLRALRKLADRIEPAWVSDHLCWTGAGGINAHDLLPLPYTEEALLHVADRVGRVQEALGRRILLENVSSYLSYTDSTLTEWEFLATLAEMADCLILLDVNNVHVSSVNHRFDPLEYLDAIPAARVWQHHLAGHTRQGGMLVDTHDQPVPEPVWALYQAAVDRFGRVSTLIERDDNIPPLGELMLELDRLRRAAASLPEPDLA